MGLADAFDGKIPLSQEHPGGQTQHGGGRGSIFPTQVSTIQVTRSSAAPSGRKSKGQQRVVEMRVGTKINEEPKLKGFGWESW